MSTPHVNLSSYPGGGKTTLTKLLLNNYSSLLIPKFTTRPPRPTEDIEEYIFMEEEEFVFHKKADHFIAVESLSRYGKIHYNAIPKIEFWPLIPENTEVIVSVFGENASLVKQYVPEIKLVFIDYKNIDILIKRLYLRCLLDNSDFEEKKRVIEAYTRTGIKNNYDYIIYNDGSIENTLEQILDLVKIPTQKLLPGVEKKTCPSI